MEATVPGTVHTDLYKNVKIDDPFYRSNEKDLQWIDQVDWEYRKTFFVNQRPKPGEKLVLVFEGIDTYSEIFLNGQPILETDNMFRTWKVDIGSYLRKSKKNELVVKLKSPTETAKPIYMSREYPLLAANDQAREKYSIYTRKAPYHYGWDWGPRFVTAGIWRPVTLLAQSDQVIDNCYYQIVALSPQKAQVEVLVTIQSTENKTADLWLCQEEEASELARKSIDLKPGSNQFSLSFEVLDPELWWPNGMGEQALYTFECNLETNSTRSIQKTRIGLRTIELVQEPDQWGESFYFKVNGRPLFAKGANYIPQDNFLNHVMPTEYRHLLNSAVEANMNMIRVWGGGIYENDWFYNLCDELGLLVWQDFMFACSLYPGDRTFLESVKHEAIDNIIRLRNHPCLALWCGNNENQEAWFNWGWQRRYQTDQVDEISTHYQELFHQLLPTLVNEFDSQTDYWPSSPAAGKEYGQLANTRSGDYHYWEVWHGRKDFETYASFIPRFSSEYGFQSFPEYKTISSYTLPDDRHIDSPIMKAHQRHPIGNKLILNYMERYYPVPDDFESFIYVSQVMQGEGLKIAFEGLRRNRPQCMGSLYWQLNDCWPVASWSGIDYYGRWKALHYQAKRAYEPLLLSIWEEEEELQLHVVSDLAQPVEGLFTFQAMGFDGRIWYYHEMENAFLPDSAFPVFTNPVNALIGSYVSHDEVFFLATFENETDTIFSAPYYLERDKNLDLPDVKLSYEIYENGGSYYLTIKTDNLARQVYLRYDGETEVRFHENYFDLLPNQQKTIRIHKRDKDPFKSEEITIFVMNEIKS